MTATVGDRADGPGTLIRVGSIVTLATERIWFVEALDDEPGGGHLSHVDRHSLRESSPGTPPILSAWSSGISWFGRRAASAHQDSSHQREFLGGVSQFDLLLEPALVDQVMARIAPESVQRCRPAIRGSPTTKEAGRLRSVPRYADVSPLGGGSSPLSGTELAQMGGGGTRDTAPRFGSRVCMIVDEGEHSWTQRIAGTVEAHTKRSWVDGVD